jgi:predicted nucleic acid-binding protein
MGMNKSAIIAVFDTGPIIHLDELNCLDLLGDFREILLPDAVLQEIRQHRPLALKRSNLSFIRSPRKYPADEALRTMCRIFSLDAGETNALALMEKNTKAIFFTDDASARLVAEQMRFKVHGTIGILIRSLRRGQMKPEQGDL